MRSGVSTLSRGVGVAALVSGLLSCSGADDFQTAAHAPYPAIPSGGGATLSRARLVTLGYSSDDALPALAEFADFVAESGFVTEVAGEYGITDLEHALHVQIDDAAPTSLDAEQVDALLSSFIARGTLPQASAADSPFVYALFFPAQTSITRFGVNACERAGDHGYHERSESSAVSYLVVPSCEPAFSALLSQLGSEQVDFARLLVDTLTNPSPQNEPAFALTDDSEPFSALGHEVGDLCWGRFVQRGPGYYLQRAWSNRGASRGSPCVPAEPSAIPFGISSVPASKQTVDVGVAFGFRVEGWSARARPDWSLRATPFRGTYAIQIALSESTINNGRTSALELTLPFSLPSGTEGAVLLQADDGVELPAWPVTFRVR